MSPDKFIDIACEVFCNRNFFNMVPPDFPNRRQLILLNSSLNKLITERPSEAEFTLGSMSAKKFHKKRGKHDADIGRRLRKVRSLFETSRRDWLRKKGSIDGKPYSRHAFGVWNDEFKKIVADSVQHVKKKLVESSRKALKH